MRQQDQTIRQGETRKDKRIHYEMKQDGDKWSNKTRRDKQRQKRQDRATSKDERIQNEMKQDDESNGAIR
jgi:hypothetical protein